MSDMRNFFVILLIFGVLSCAGHKEIAQSCESVSVNVNGGNEQIVCIGGDDCEMCKRSRIIDTLIQPFPGDSLELWDIYIKLELTVIDGKLAIRSKKSPEELGISREAYEWCVRGIELSNNEIMQEKR